MRGHVHRFSDNIDTDVIIPARYLTSTDEAELARHCMEGIDPDFPNRVSPGDLIVAGRNFGSGSSREHAPIALKASGISCVIASTFARIFYRNALNLGLPVVECPEMVAITETGEEVEVDLETGIIFNHTKQVTAQAKAFPDFMRGLLDAGGLVPFLKNRFSLEGEPS